jgi:tripartite-type tricarboxylate transporter receptor subunit TctC
LLFRSLFAAALIAVGASSALAQDNYPSQTIRIVVPHPPGGFTDIIARLVAQRLQVNTGQTVVVDNRGGGGGTIAERFVATAPGDGYTLLVTGRDLLSRGEMHAKLPYDVDKDFRPVSLLAWSPLVMVVNPSFPASNLQEFIAAAKRTPGKLTYASGGVGTGAHVATEMLARETGMQLVHVPYRGPGQAATDVLGGQVPMMMMQAAVALPHIKAGKLKAIAVPGAKRLATLPDVPTVAESGVPGFNASPWFGIMAPGSTPQPVVEKVAAELRKAMSSPEVRNELVRQNAEPMGSTPEEFAALIRAETPRFRKLVKELDIRDE